MLEQVPTPEGGATPSPAGKSLPPDLHGPATCANCVAVCCRLTVVLETGDVVPPHLTSQLPGGLRVMAKDASGWCKALAADGVSCGIYAARPQTCRRFAVNGPYCRAMRRDHASMAGQAAPV